LTLEKNEESDKTICFGCKFMGLQWNRVGLCRQSNGI